MSAPKKIAPYTTGNAQKVTPPAVISSPSPSNIETVAVYLPRRSRDEFHLGGGGEGRLCIVYGQEVLVSIAGRDTHHRGEAYIPIAVGTGDPAVGPEGN